MRLRIESAVGYRVTANSDVGLAAEPSQNGEPIIEDLSWRPKKFDQSVASDIISPTGREDERKRERELKVDSESLFPSALHGSILLHGSVRFRRASRMPP